MTRASFLLALCLCAPTAAPALAQEQAQGAASSPPTVTAGDLEQIPIFAPATTPPKAMVVYFSDRSGWSSSDDAAVAALKASGDVVLAVDFSKYATTLDKGDGDCTGGLGDIFDAAQTAQRQLGIQTYLPPIVVGAGEAATFAYATLSGAAPNMLGGVVGAGFANRLGLRLPICSAAKPSRTSDGKAYQYGFEKKLPNSAALLVAPELYSKIDKLADARGDDVDVSELDSANLPEQIAKEVADLARVARPFGDLPAIDLPASTKPRALAILISGDGGWRDLDKTIGEWLATQGVHVVGLDALHYFWSKRTPDALARDIAFLVDAADPDDNLPIMLIGYSFGADTIPFAFPLLPKAVQDRTRLFGLLAPGQTTSFQVTIGGWLGIDDSGYAITPAIAALPAARVICVYGEEDDDSACADRSLGKATIVKTSGGHHFDGNYTAIARRFLERIGSR